MTQQMAKEVDEKYAPIVAAFKKKRDVKGGVLMASFSLSVNGKIFAFFPRGTYVVKLPKRRVDEMIEAGTGKSFGPGKRIMKGWVAVDAERESWISIAQEAYDFVKRGSLE